MFEDYNNYVLTKSYTCYVVTKGAKLGIFADWAEVQPAIPVDQSCRWKGFRDVSKAFEYARSEIGPNYYVSPRMSIITEPGETMRLKLESRIESLERKIKNYEGIISYYKDLHPEYFEGDDDIHVDLPDVKSVAFTMSNQALSQDMLHLRPQTPAMKKKEKEVSAYQLPAQQPAIPIESMLIKKDEPSTSASSAKEEKPPSTSIIEQLESKMDQKMERFYLMMMQQLETLKHSDIDSLSKAVPHVIVPALSDQPDSSKEKTDQEK